jgi:hypothetical protein
VSYEVRSLDVTIEEGRWEGQVNIQVFTKRQGGEFVEALR